MTTPYRSHVDALRDRKEALERELSAIKAKAAQLDELRAREREVARELADVAAKLGADARPRLPLLDQVRVASPCNASWAEMLGDERVRFCVSCEKNVYNLSAMAREEAEALLARRLGDELCVRYYQRADGTILTEDCPVGVTKKRRKKMALAVAGAGALAFSAAVAVTRSTCRQGEIAMGTMEAPIVAAPTAVPTEEADEPFVVEGEPNLQPSERPPATPPASATAAPSAAPPASATPSVMHVVGRMPAPHTRGRRE